MSQEPLAAVKRALDDDAASDLSRDEVRALRALEELAEIWPETLTVHVSSADSLAFNVIRTPKPGDEAYDNLNFATVVTRIKIPSASSA